MRNFYADGGNMREAEVRFSATDCIVKGICRLSGCLVAAEESISKREKAVKKGCAWAKLLPVKRQHNRKHSVKM